MLKKRQVVRGAGILVSAQDVLDLLPTSKSLNQELSVSTSTVDLADTEGRALLSWAAERGDALAVKNYSSILRESFKQVF